MKEPGPTTVLTHRTCSGKAPDLSPTLWLKDGKGNRHAGPTTSDRDTSGDRDKVVHKVTTLGLGKG